MLIPICNPLRRANQGRCYCCFYNILEVINGFTPLLQLTEAKQEDCHHGNPVGCCFDLHWC